MSFFVFCNTTQLYISPGQGPAESPPVWPGEGSGRSMPAGKYGKAIRLTLPAA